MIPGNCVILFLLQTAKGSPATRFCAIVVHILYWYQLPLTSLFLASRPTHTFPDTSQSSPCIEQLLPQHCSLCIFLFKNRLERLLLPKRTPPRTRLLHQYKGTSSKWLPLQHEMRNWSKRDVKMAAGP